jgi:dihydrofolate reductase
MLISLLVAMTRKGVIGRDNQLPWHLPNDLKHFKALTLGKPILMGRRTFEAIGRPLPGRTNLVLTGNTGFSVPGVQVVGSIDEALNAVAGSPELAIIGGATVYRQTLPIVQRIYVTWVEAEVEGDTRFPPLDSVQWRPISRQDQPADERHAYALSFETLERIGT